MNQVIKQIILVVVVAGASVLITKGVVQNTLSVSSENTETSVPQPTQALPYEGWGVVVIGEIAAFRIPPECKTDGAAGSTYVVCVESGNENPLPSMVFSTDGEKLSIRRWEGLDWPQWDAVVGSLQIQSPLGRAVEITIEK